ncbi:MAG TPA: glycosyltransferase family 39 protein [Woeseiaceae bacterium]|nr:glycosyltransferase family 39 protein [Woeseiaceae bacterium]
MAESPVPWSRAAAPCSRKMRCSGHGYLADVLSREFFPGGAGSSTRLAFSTDPYNHASSREGVFMDPYLAGVRPWLILIGLCLVLFLPGIASLPPTDRDEARYAQATKQMLETGDFVDIRFQEEPRNKKPVGIYWLQAASAWTMGEAGASAIWAYRIPSVLGAAAAVLFTFALGRVLFGRRTAFLGAAFLAASLLLTSVAHIATTDAVLLATVVGAQWALARIWTEARAGRDAGPWTAVGFWVAQGAGILIKGPVTPVVSILTVLALKWADREVRWLQPLRPLWGVPLGAAITLPWFVAVSMSSGGAFVADAIGHDLLPKLLSGQESHGFPPGCYLLLMTLTFWPGSIMVWPGLLHAWRHRKTDAALRFCLAWLVPAWLLFELLPTKLPHYVLPLYPALALITACATLAAEGNPVPRLQRWDGRLVFAIWVAIGVLLGAGTLALPVVLGLGFEPFALAPAAVGLDLAVYAAPTLWRGRVLAPAAASVAAAAIGFASLFQIVLPRIDGIWLSRDIARLVTPCRTHEHSTPLVAAGYSEPSIIFLTGTDTRLLPPDAAAAWMSRHPNSLAVVAGEEVPAFRSGLASYGGRARPVGTVTGFNYSKGRRMTLTLFAGPAAGRC